MSETEVKARAFDSLMAYLERNGKCLSLHEAVAAVGGEMRLLTLVSDGHVREEENNATRKNCKRLFRAADVYAHVRTYKH